MAPVMTNPARGFRASVQAMGRGLDSTAAVITTLKHLLFIPLGLVGGAAAVWRGFVLEGMMLLGVGVALTVNLAAKLGLESMTATKVACIGAIVTIGSFILLMVREVGSPGAWWPALVLVTTGGAWAMRRVFDQPSRARRLPETSMQPR